MLHTIESQQVETLALPAGSLHVSADRVVTEEIALATGVGTGEVARRLCLATAPRRHRVVLAALRAGATSLHRALLVASETAQLPDADVTTVEEAVLAPSRDGQPVPHRTFASRLRRAVASVDARGSEGRRRQARSPRGVFGRLTQDGMGALTVTTDAASVAAVLDRLDTQARTARRGGDPPQPRPAAGRPRRPRALLGASDHPEAAAGPMASERPAQRSGESSGEAPALAWIVVPFEVATGEADTACELPGHGWVTAAHAREVLTRPGSVWATLPVDLRTGQAISRPTASYRPTPAMLEHVRAVDGICRGPGCQVVATRCDLDHETPWPRGDTAVGNLYAKHRLHHNVKTDGI